MPYKQFIPITNLNFQFNRVLTYGEQACREEELWEIAPKLTEYDPAVWHDQWRSLAIRAESEGRMMHAAYYHRMSEFFLPDGGDEKQKAYENFRRCFYEAVDKSMFESFEAPYEGKTLPGVIMKAENEKGIVLAHGGFDSFIEEFFLQLKKITENGYTVILFEGPGQGRPLRQGLKMPYDWERPVGAVLDHLRLDDVTLIGVSLGGYLGMRASAFEPRIKRFVAWNIIYDAMEIFTRNVPDEIKPILYQMIKDDKKDEVNDFINQVRQSNDLIDWTVNHGMYISGAETPFDYLNAFTKFNTREISSLVKQDVLLTAGENDHFVPLEQYYQQKEALVNARSVTGRIYTAEEGADQHCQVGALDLVINEIIGWLDGLH